MASSHPSKLFLHDHPVSSYAQKVRIALREKGIPFDYATPKGLGTGQRLPDLAEANPRLEVPALVIDDDFKIFDSKVILGYLEDEYPETPLLPKDPKQRAQARMIEEVVDTQYVQHHLPFTLPSSKNPPISPSTHPNPANLSVPQHHAIPAPLTQKTPLRKRSTGPTAKSPGATGPKAN